MLSSCLYLLSRRGSSALRRGGRHRQVGLSRLPDVRAPDDRRDVGAIRRRRLILRLAVVWRSDRHRWTAPGPPSSRLLRPGGRTRTPGRPGRSTGSREPRSCRPRRPFVLRTRPIAWVAGVTESGSCSQTQIGCEDSPRTPEAVRIAAPCCGHGRGCVSKTAAAPLSRPWSPAADPCAGLP